MEDAPKISAAPPDETTKTQENPHVPDKGKILQESPHVPDKGKNSPNESEYDSAGSYSEEGARNSGSETEGSVGLERESGDGQESVPARKVDDDEDKKNPQYIPKRGTFYEHDDRTADDIEEAQEVEGEKEKDGKKKVWQDKKERWSHDRFNDSDQAPKSRTELVQIYGYDIRNEDGPPRARRRRRYGRGPNKYTRNWEDEDAYTSKPPVITRKKKPFRNPGSEEFPPLSNSIVNDDEDRRREEYDNENDRHTNSPEPPRQQEIPRQLPQKVGSGRVIKPRKEITDSDYRGFTSKTRLGRNVKTDQKILTRPQRSEDFIQSQNFTNKSGLQELERDMSKLNVDGKAKQRQGSVPPRLQSEQKGSKRYSSMRQRSLPESATPPFTQHSNYYNEYNQGQQGIISSAIHPSTTQVPQIAPPPLPPIPQVPVTATPILQAPQFAPPFPPGPPPFLQASVPVPAPPFIAQPTPQIINYVPTQPQFPPQSFQGFQQPFATQPPELFQPPSGITYYSADQQVSSQRPVHLKRPKAAIPIVAPPPMDLKGSKLKEEDVSSFEDISDQHGTTDTNSSYAESDAQQ